MLSPMSIRTDIVSFGLGVKTEALSRGRFSLQQLIENKKCQENRPSDMVEDK